MPQPPAGLGADRAKGRSPRDRPYTWIEEQAIPPLAPGVRLVLFGAGEGSVQFLGWLADCGTNCRVLAVADNDPTMHGKELCGLPIVAPAAVPGLGADLVVVTTVSGREAVGRQLEGMGLREGEQFVRIGAYPAAGMQNVERILELDASLGLLAGVRDAVHVGPGGFLPLECALFALRGIRVRAVDAFSFGLDWPDVTGRGADYAAARERTLSLAAAQGRDAGDAGRRWDSLFAERGGRLVLDGVPFLFPHDFSALPLPDASVDLACSFAVLEHVRDPAACVAELFRVLRPGGSAVQTIVTRDHRSFGKVDGYTPISYRRHSEAEWEGISGGKFYQNRLAPWQWRSLFAAGGFAELFYREHSRYAPDAAERACLHPDFAGWSEAEQRAVDCTLVARRPK